jgi:hypothetical protein
MGSLASPVATTTIGHQGRMKLLCSSSDLRELEGLVKRLVCVGIRCAVSKDSGSSQLSVWVQQDNDFPLALRIFTNRPKPRPVPHWASALDLPLPAIEKPATARKGNTAIPVPCGAGTLSVAIFDSNRSTRTGTA